jgi:ABC-2 type transport system permease protein
MTTAEVLDIFVPGILAMLALIAGMSAGWEVIMDLKDGVVERFRVTSAHRASMLLGVALHDMTMFLMPSIVIIGVSALFGFSLNIGGLLVMILLLCLFTLILSAFSAALALKLKEIGGLSAVLSGLQLPMMLLAGILIPLSLGPRWLEIMGHFNPLYYAVEASRDLAGGSILTDSVYIAFAVFTVLAIITVGWAARVYRNAVK